MRPYARNSHNSRTLTDRWKNPFKGIGDVGRNKARSLGREREPARMQRATHLGHAVFKRKFLGTADPSKGTSRSRGWGY